MREPTILDPKRKCIYNNSSKILTEEQKKFLKLGLNFSVTPNKFPLIEYIAAAENLCQSLEELQDDESLEKTQKIRNLLIDHVRKGVRMKIKDNLSAKEKKII